MSNFESFSEDLVPRIVPQPTLHPVLDMSKPIVPEVSLIFDDGKKPAQTLQPKSYKEWKQYQQQHPLTKFTSHQIPTTDRKKIVTFDLPTENHSDNNVLLPSVESTPMNVCKQLDLSVCEPKNVGDIGCHTNSANCMINTQYKQHIHNNFTQQQYNNKRLVASRQLNLEQNSQPFSKQVTHINQMPHQVNINQNEAISKDITINDVYQLIQNVQLNSQTPMVTNNRPTDSTEFNGPNMDLRNNRQIDQLSLVPGTLLPSPNLCTANNEPTMRDMFNIILRQQEQLMNIQKQVQVLLDRSVTAAHDQIEAVHRTTNQMIDNSNVNVNQIDPLTKQVGVMTSLEINVQNFKPNATQSDENFNTPNANNANKNISKPCGCMCNCESQKRPQSADSKSNDDSFGMTPMQGDTQTGWTFYGNILNQVNGVLQNTSPTSNTRLNDSKNPQIKSDTNNHCNDTKKVSVHRHSNVIPNIRSAQFKQVGFHIEDVNISAMTKRITFDSPSNEIPRMPDDRIAPTDNSLLMNTLAMKYLPCNLNTQSPKFVRNGATYTTNHSHKPPTIETSVNHQNECISRHANTDMSMTSYRYMEKYGLL